MFVFFKKAKAEIIRLIENKIWHLSWANLEIQSRMTIGEILLGKEYRETFCFARMKLNCAWIDLWIEILRYFLPEGTIYKENKDA